MKRVSGILGTVLCCALASSIAVAETISQGGQPERFKGEGDNIPPECVLTAPDAANEPFLVQWNCIDDNCEPEEIRTELWLYRGEGLAGELVGNFLGFPANVKVDEVMLRAARVADALPVRFRLLARDRAGTATVSPFITVAAQDNTLTGCTVNVNAAAVPSDGDTTGQPAKTITISNASVDTTVSGSTLTIVTEEAVAASPCDDIGGACDDDSEISLNLQVTLGEENAATGTVTLSPGDISGVAVEGTAQVDGLELTTLSVEGTQEIDGAETTISVTCGQ